MWVGVIAHILSVSVSLLLPVSHSEPVLVLIFSGDKYKGSGAHGLQARGENNKSKRGRE